MTALDEALQKKLAEAATTTGITWAERIAQVWVEQAVAGNFAAIQVILQRLEGPLAATHRATTPLSHPDDD